MAARSKGSPDPAPGQPSEHTQAMDELCVHEAGHAVACVLLGGVVDRCEVFGLDGKAKPGGKTITRGLSAHAQDRVAYAGIWCEARFRSGGPPIARELYRAMDRNGTDTHQLFARRDPGRLSHTHIQPALQRCWRQVMTIAQQLAGHGRVGDVDVRLALGLSKLPAQADFQLAQIRSGGAPTT